MRIAGSPTSSGIICADNYRLLQLGSSRGWRAIGTLSTVYRLLLLGLNRGWRTIGTLSTVYRVLQLGMRRWRRAVGTLSTGDARALMRKRVRRTLRGVAGRDVRA